MFHFIVLFFYFLNFCLVFPSEHSELSIRSHSAPPTMHSCVAYRYYEIITNHPQKYKRTHNVLAKLKGFTQQDLEQYHNNPARYHYRLTKFSSNQTLLHHAACTGRTDIVKKIIQQLVHTYARSEDLREKISEYVDSEDANGYTALWYAIENNCLSIARQLLTYNANLYFSDKNDTTLIHLAIQKNNLKAILLLCLAEQHDLKQFFRSITDSNQIQQQMYTYLYSELPALSLLAFQNKNKENPIDLCPQKMLPALKRHVYFLQYFLENIPSLKKIHRQIEATHNAISSYNLLVQTNSVKST